MDLGIQEGKMTISKDIFDKIIKEIDRVNKADPTIVAVGEEIYPAEYLYSLRMTKELQRFCPDASSQLQVACRAQHIARWKYPRTDYPEGRAGYLKWRSELYKIHADLTSDIIMKISGDSSFAEAVKKKMVNKVKGSSEGSQIIEDVACLVFLKYYFDDFIKKHEETKLLNIVKKTWDKMSEEAHKAALKFEFTDEQKTVIEKALK